MRIFSPGRCTQYLVLAMALTQPARAWRVKRDAPLTDLVPSPWWKTCLIASITIQLQTFTIIIPSVLEILQHAIECCLVRVVASFAKFKAPTLPFVPRVQVPFLRAVEVGALGCIATECKLCSSRKLSQSTGFTFP